MNRNQYMSKVIINKYNAFVFKWRHQLSEGCGLQVNQTTPCWGEFLIKNTKFFDTARDGLMYKGIGPYYPDYDSRIGNVFTLPVLTSTNIVTNKLNGLSPIDVSVCLIMCYPDDAVIKITGIIDTESKRKMYIAITAFGSVICKTITDTKLIKFGTNQYINKFIDLIKAFRSDNSLDDWIKMLEDIDALQTIVDITTNNPSFYYQ